MYIYIYIHIHVHTHTHVHTEGSKPKLWGPTDGLVMACAVQVCVGILALVATMSLLEARLMGRASCFIPLQQSGFIKK